METDPTDPPLSALLVRTQERVARGLQSLLLAELAQLAEDLLSAAERWTTTRERQALFEAATALRQQPQDRADRAMAAFNARASLCLSGAVFEIAAAPHDPADLRLLDEEELAIQILETDLATRLRARGDHRYSDYAGRVARLTERAWPDDDRLPLGARTLGHAITQGLRGVGARPEARAALRLAALDRLIPRLIELLVDTSAALAEAGVTPMPVSFVPEPAGALTPDSEGRQSPEQAAAAAHAASPPAEPRPQGTSPPEVSPPAQATDFLSDALQVVRRLDSSPLASEAPSGTLGRIPRLQSVTDIERDAIAFAHSIGSLPFSRASRMALFTALRSRLQADGATGGQLAMVDVVSAMFDYVIDERRLPEASKPLVWRLQQPVLALAMFDPGYMGEESRSVRRLVEHFGAIATAYADDLVRGGELFKRLETVVRAVEIIAGALQTRTAVMSRQVEQEYSRASRGVAQLVERVVNERQSLESAPARSNRRDYRRRPGKAREREVSEQLRSMLTQRLDSHPVPDAMREFILEVWLRRLRTAVLRAGEDSPEYTAAIKVVDDLLWTVDEAQRKGSRRELAERIPPLVRVLNDGLREIGARDEESKGFFDELFLVHLRRLQPRSSGRTAFVPRPAWGDTPVPVLEEEMSVVSSEPDRLRVATRQATSPPAPQPPEPSQPATPHAGTASVSGPGRSRASEVTGFLKASAQDPSSRAWADTAPAARRAEPSLKPKPKPKPKEGPEQRLIRILEAVDLSDAPQQREVRGASAQEAVDNLAIGDWLELVSSDGRTALAKVAWINERRSVVLLMRHPDRKALTLRTAELQQRVTRGRVRLLKTDKTLLRS